MAANTGPVPLRKILLNSDRKSDEEVVSPRGEKRASSERGHSEEPMVTRPHLSTDLKNCWSETRRHWEEEYSRQNVWKP